MSSGSPARFAAFEPVELAEVRPEGWLRNFLQAQREGLTGHQQHGGMPFCDTTVGWAPGVDFMGVLSHDPGCQQKEPVFHFTGRPGQEATWVTLEQWAYWIDGVVRCGALIEDEEMMASAQAVIETILAKAEPDGYLGRPSMKYLGEQDHKVHQYIRWPQTVIFRAMMAWHSATGDERIPPAIRRHFQSGTDIDHSLHRNVTNVEAMLWAYSKTGDTSLLDLAVRTYDAYCAHSGGDSASAPYMSSDRVPNEHGVTYNELGKLPAILYAYTGRDSYLKAVVKGFRKIELDHELASGLHSSAEFLDGNDALAAHETCNVSDHTWTLGYLLAASGDTAYADKIEKICFNAGPGSVTEDFSALQYFSCPNQVIADQSSAHTDFKRGSQFMSYRPNPGTECCAANVHRFMPNFAARMWMRQGPETFVALLHGPSRLDAKVGREAFQIRAETAYPFEDRILYTIEDAPEKTGITLRFRNPNWCARPLLKLNDSIVEAKAESGLLSLRHRFRRGDRIELQLPMRLRILDWPGGGVVLERGPLVFSLRIKERRERQPDIRSTDRFPAWNILPESPWNYALAVDRDRLEECVELVAKKLGQGNPWAAENAPVELKVPARRIRNWSLIESKEIECKIYGGFQPLDDKVRTETLRGDFRFTPPLPSPKELPERLEPEVETVTLVPYGCTRLRLSVFPDATTGSSLKTLA